MNISECMTRDVRVGSPDDTLGSIAKLMVELDAGVIPIGENDRLVGMITDRDLAVRGLAEGRGPESKVRELMSSDVRYCYDDDSVENVLRNMGELKVRRLPVVNRDKRLVGIVSIGDMATEASPAPTGQALGQISQSGGAHNQSASGPN